MATVTWIVTLVIGFLLFRYNLGMLLDWFDLNLEIIKVIRSIPVVGEYLALFLYFFNAERGLVFVEVGVVIWAIFKVFRRRFRWRSRKAS